MIINPDNTDVNNQVLDEKETRRRLLMHARLQGCEKEMLILYANMYKAAKNCTNDKERKDIGKLYIVEMFRLLSSHGQLFIDGQMVIDE